MDDAVAPVMERYVHGDGSVMWPTREDFTGIDGLDDAYESFHNWPLFYLMGGGDHLLEYSHLAWEGITRQFSRYDTGHGHPMVIKEYEQGYDWMHQGEGYAFFYNLCLADPGNERNAERARRYAGFYLNEDPEALNYDPAKKLIKCAHNGSMGPAFRNFDKHYTVYRYDQWKPWPLPFHDLPGIDSVEDLQKPGMEELMGRALVERMGRGDVATNLGATTLVTNAYLFGGEAKYRDWVVEYTESWMDRTRQNGGVIPDNVGLSGEGRGVHRRQVVGRLLRLDLAPRLAPDGRRRDRRRRERGAHVPRPRLHGVPALTDRPAHGEGGGGAGPPCTRPITTTTRDGTATRRCTRRR